MDGAEVGKPSCPAEGEALRFRVPELPAVSVNGAAVMPDGKPERVTTIGPLYVLLLVVIAMGTLCWPG
jgi:hypothetical protein